MTRKHSIEVKRVHGRCEVPGHTDLRITCSCGFNMVLTHGTIEEAEPEIMAHRLGVIEAISAIEFGIVITPGV